MEIPITFRFFEKLNLFQEAGKLDRENRPEWKVERQILSWAANPQHHRNLYTPLTVDMALQHSEITGLAVSDPENVPRYIEVCFGNLVMRGLATWSDGVPGGIRFTRDGFFLGEIINEIRNEPGKKELYYFLYGVSWAIFVAGTIIILAEAVKDLLPVFGFIGELSRYLCR